MREKEAALMTYNVIWNWGDKKNRGGVGAACAVAYAIRRSRVQQRGNRRPSMLGEDNPSLFSLCIIITQRHKEKVSGKNARGRPLKIWKIAPQRARVRVRRVVVVIRWIANRLQVNNEGKRPARDKSPEGPKSP